VLSDFRRDAEDICIVLGFYAASIDNVLPLDAA
jgi:hypothetical protein